MTKYTLVYTTLPDLKTANKIAKILIDDKYAACVNVTPAVNSYFPWQGELKDCLEVLLLAKTSKDLLDKLFDRIKQLHPYETPAILSVPINKIDDDYGNFVNDNLIQQDA